MQLKEIELELLDFTGHNAPWSAEEMANWSKTFKKPGYCTNINNNCDEDKCECN